MITQPYPTHHPKEISWGILGCGEVTEVKSGPAFNRIPGSRLHAVMRRQGKLAEDYARRHEVPKWYDRADDLITDPDINAVYIATPPQSHCELALKVAAAGKACYVEKPMARNTPEAQQMTDAFQAAGQPLFVAYYRRALPQFLAVRDWIQGQQLGALREIRYDYASGAQRQHDGTPDNWRLDPDISGGGLFWDLGSHALDLIDFWCGPLQQVQGSRKALTPGQRYEDIAQLNGWCSDIAVSARFNFVAPESRDQFELTFEHGILRTACFSNHQLEILRPGQTPLQENYPPPPHIQQPLIEQVVHALQQGTPVVSTAASALRTNQVLDQIPLI